MPRQLFDHAKAKDLAFLGMMKDVKPNQSGIQISMVRHGQIGIADSLCSVRPWICKNPVKRSGDATQEPADRSSGSGPGRLKGACEKGTFDVLGNRVIGGGRAGTAQ
jgi:hypothetical protein